MKTIFSARVIQKYRNRNLAWYGVLGHRGVDLDFKYEPLPSPVTGVVRAVVYDPLNKRQTGQCIFVTDARGAVHVFAHMRQIDVSTGQSIKRGDRLGVTGNTGTITSGPHLHYEVITPVPFRWWDAPMVRSLTPVRGFNTDPIAYTKNLYWTYNIPIP